MNTKTFYAFSLIELLISLIIISLIIAAFAPIMTKKLNKNNVAVTAKTISNDCSKFDNQNRCMICTNNSCTLCSTQINTTEGYFVDPNASCDYKECKNVFENCLKCNKDFCTGCKDGYWYDINEKNCKKCSSNCIKCENSTKCLTCNGGYNLVKGKCIRNASCVKIGNICAARYNAGDPNGLPLVNVSVNGTIKNTTIYSSNTTQKYCWQGTTAYYCGFVKNGYSGCNRTACNYLAAETICETHGWRLPTKNEIAPWVNIGDLNLCSGSSDYGWSECAQTGNCPYSKDGDCFTYGVWSLEGGVYFSHLGWKYNLRHVNFSASVRCVYDL